MCNKVRYNIKIEVKKRDKARIENIRQNIEFVKGHLNLIKTSTSTVSADLLEELLAVWFEYANKNSPASLPNKKSMTHEHSMPNDSPDSDLSSSGVPESLVNPGLQLHTPASVDDAIYLVSHSALRRLMNHFLLTMAWFVGAEEDWIRLIWNWREHQNTAMLVRPPSNAATNTMSSRFLLLVCQQNTM